MAEAFERIFGELPQQFEDNEVWIAGLRFRAFQDGPDGRWQFYLLEHCRKCETEVLADVPFDLHELGRALTERVFSATHYCTTHGLEVVAYLGGKQNVH